MGENEAVPSSGVGRAIFEHQAHAAGAVSRARRLRGDMTLAEKKLWGELRKLQLHIRRQAPIGRYVAERDAGLNSQGYRVLRIRGGHVLRDAARAAEYVAAAIHDKALPLDGGGWGGGVSAEFEENLRLALDRSSSGDEESRSAPNAPASARSAHTPPSPTLPPSRGKGA